MAEALGLDDKRAYSRWAWTAPEEEKLPDPQDWDENPEDLSAQAIRWDKDQERMRQELLRDLETLEKLGAPDMERSRGQGPVQHVDVDRS